METKNEVIKCKGTISCDYLAIKTPLGVLRFSSTDYEHLVHWDIKKLYNYFIWETHSHEEQQLVIDVLANDIEKNLDQQLGNIGSILTSGYTPEERIERSEEYITKVLKRRQLVKELKAGFPKY